jgi:hypothetical protein
MNYIYENSFVCKIVIKLSIYYDKWISEFDRLWQRLLADECYYLILTRSQNSEVSLHFAFYQDFQGNHGFLSAKFCTYYAVLSSFF